MNDFSLWRMKEEKVAQLIGRQFKKKLMKLILNLNGAEINQQAANQAVPLRGKFFILSFINFAWLLKERGEMDCLLSLISVHFFLFLHSFNQRSWLNERMKEKDKLIWEMLWVMGGDAPLPQKTNNSIHSHSLNSFLLCLHLIFIKERS